MIAGGFFIDIQRNIIIFDKEYIMYKVLLCIFLISDSITAQTLQLNVVSSQGNYFSNNDFQLSWTLGEVVTDTYTLNQKTFLTQGFEQPIFKTASDLIPVTEPHIFPNPTSGPLTILLPTVGSYEMNCYDVLGQILFKEDFISDYLKLDITYLRDAYYFFVIKNAAGEYMYRIKIVKIN